MYPNITGLNPMGMTTFVDDLTIIKYNEVSNIDYESNKEDNY